MAMLVWLVLYGRFVDWVYMAESYEPQILPTYSSNLAYTADVWSTPKNKACEYTTIG